MLLNLRTYARDWKHPTKEEKDFVIENNHKIILEDCKNACIALFRNNINVADHANIHWAIHQFLKCHESYHVCGLDKQYENKIQKLTDEVFEELHRNSIC